MNKKAAALTLVIVKAMQQNLNNFNKQCCVKLLNTPQGEFNEWKHVVAVN